MKEQTNHERLKATNTGVVPSFSASSEHFLLDSSTHLCQSSLVLPSRVLGPGLNSLATYCYRDSARLGVIHAEFAS